jgi:hypothetical protein
LAPPLIIDREGLDEIFTPLAATLEELSRVLDQATRGASNA